MQQKRSAPGCQTVTSGAAHKEHLPMTPLSRALAATAADNNMQLVIMAVKILSINKSQKCTTNRQSTYLLAEPHVRRQRLLGRFRRTFCCSLTCGSTGMSVSRGRLCEWRVVEVTRCVKGSGGVDVRWMTVLHRAGHPIRTTHQATAEGACWHGCDIARRGGRTGRGYGWWVGGRPPSVQNHWLHHVHHRYVLESSRSQTW